MTLAVAAKYPWSNFSELIKMGAPVSQAVIMASDSRWTYDDYYIPYEDIGTKLFQLGKDCGAVYAGDVKAGEHSIKVLSSKLARRKTPDFQRSLVLAKSTFSRVYQYHQKERESKGERVYPLYILVGICNVVGEASLIYFSSESNFKPVFITGVYGVGIREAYASFEEKFMKEIESEVNKELKTRHRYPVVRYMPIQQDAEHVGILLAAMLEDVIKTATYKTIGGKMQYGIATKDGFQMWELLIATDPTNEGSGWTRVTASPEEITTFRKRFNLSATYQNIDKFGIFQICD